MFGIYGFISGNTLSAGSVEHWLWDDVLSNIKIDSTTTNSRVGIITFWGTTANIGISIGEYTEGQLLVSITNSVQWSSGGWTNSDTILDAALLQFDTISTPNSQQILVLMVDDSPRRSSSHPLSVCQYKQALESRGMTQKRQCTK